MARMYAFFESCLSFTQPWGRARVLVASESKRAMESERKGKNKEIKRDRDNGRAKRE